MLPVVDLRGSDRDPAGLLPRAPPTPSRRPGPGCGSWSRTSPPGRTPPSPRRPASTGSTARTPGGPPPTSWPPPRRRSTVLRTALLDAIERAAAFHRAQRPADLVWTDRPGVRLVQRFVPAGRRAGGARRLPLQRGHERRPRPGGRGRAGRPGHPAGPGRPRAPAILGAAALLGVEEVWLLGGAHAVAALACGTATVPAVDSVTGPGNLYTALAKREVAGRVRIDGFAGPTEVAVLADATADPLLVAVDLVAQAEHDRWPPACWSPTTPTCGRRSSRCWPGGGGRRPPRPGRGRLRRPVGHRALRRPRPCSPWPRRSPPSTWSCWSPTPASWPAGSATPAPCSSAPGPRSPLATTPPAPTTSSRPPARPGSPPAVHPRLPAHRAGGHPTTATPWPRPRPRWPPSAAAEDLPAHGRAVAARLDTGERARPSGPGTAGGCGSGTTWPGWCRTARPARRAGAAQHQRDPLRGARRGPRRPGRGGQGLELHRYPDRERPSCARPWPCTPATGSRAPGRPTAPTRSSSSSCSPSPAGRSALVVRADLRHALAAGQGQRHPAGDQGPAPRPAARPAAAAPTWSPRPPPT